MDGALMGMALPFGLTFSTHSAREIASAAMTRPPADDVALVVTPNIDHIAMLRRSPALAAAYGRAARIVCDGWPVQRYARLRGLPVARVTGCEIAAELMRMAPCHGDARFYFVVDTATTQRAVLAWGSRNGVAAAAAVPAFGFEADAAYCEQLARAVRSFETTVLIMAVGAPRSEIFVDAHRELLGACWAFCVGQAVKVELGLVRRASSRWQAAGLEWLWRVGQEPSRLARRYAVAAAGFALAVIEDQARLIRDGRP